LKELLAHLKSTVPSLRFLTTHAVVQPWNRRDPISIIGKQLAIDHGFEWWQPTPQQVIDFKPLNA
jgi:hypothetical protein